MALNFPDSPTNGQKYTDATSGETWTYESSTNSWTSDGLTTAVGVQYKGGINVTTAPPAGVKGGWQYTVTTGGAVNAGFTGLTGNIPSGTTIIFDGTNWQQAGAGVQWVRTGTELSPSSAGDSVFTSGAVKVGGTTAASNLQLKADGGIVANTDGLVYDAAQKRLALGSSSPGSLLNLSATFGTTLTTGLRIEGLGSTTNNVSPIAFYSQSSDWGTQHAANIACGNISGTDGGGYLRFSTSPNGNTAPVERIRVTGGGLVGIGTTAATARLQVKQSAARQGLWCEHPSNDTTIRVGIDSDASTAAIAASFASTGSYYPLTFSTSDTERARIDTSGRLLVGSSSQSGGSLLQVNDNRIRIATAKTPASATDTGVAGEICWDANYVYVCTATNTWKRTAISTW